METSRFHCHRSNTPNKTKDGNEDMHLQSCYMTVLIALKYTMFVQRKWVETNFGGRLTA